MIAIRDIFPPLSDAIFNKAKALVNIGVKVIKPLTPFRENGRPGPTAHEVMTGQSLRCSAPCNVSEANPAVPVGAMTCVPQTLVDYGVFACTSILRKKSGVNQDATVVGATVRRRVRSTEGRPGNEAE